MLKDADEHPRFGEYVLAAPNDEVERGLVECLLPAWTPGYSAPFEADPRKLHLIGCAFDPKTRLPSEWEGR